VETYLSYFSRTSKKKIVIVKLQNSMLAGKIRLAGLTNAKEGDKMTKLKRRGLSWGGLGLLVSSYTLWGAMSWAYRIFPYEPATLSLGILLSVISLIGIACALPKQAGWLTAWLVLALWLVLIGGVADGLLLWFGQTVSGFY